ncbi:ABC transporter permease [Treponema sp. OMZ 840]|uniref:ABC transporter permease n=1 Tax=Treponema sp. OMZ 840 TaxID=244313 RepID=UPI003D92B33E
MILQKFNLKKQYALHHSSSAKIWGILILLLVPVIAITPEFIYPANLANVMLQMAPLGIIAVGQTFVIISGNIDMSVGNQISLISLIASSLMSDNPWNILCVTLFCLIVGMCCGFLNGFLLKLFSIPPLVATLCTGYFFQGIAFALHTTSGGYIPQKFKALLTTSWGIISTPFLLFVLVFIVAWYLLSQTPYGKHLYALGGNPEVLHNSGISPNKIKIKTYMLSGFLCAVVGIYLAARLRSGSSHYGDSYTLLSITATVVGGTSMAGGTGYLSGTFAGTILVSMLTNVLNNIAFKYNLQSSYYKDIITGIILISAMFFYRKKEQPHE